MLKHCSITKSPSCISINIQNTYIFGKYLFVWAPETANKASLWQRLQINFTFNDNVCVFCFSCNIKKSKITDYLNYLKIAETIVILILSMPSFVTSALILVPFLTVALHESCTRKALFDPFISNKNHTICRINNSNMTVFIFITGI